MESMFERAEQMAGTKLTKLRWALGVNGAFAIASGVVILIWPGISLYALTILFGAWALASGIVRLAAAWSGATTHERGWLAVSSLLGIGVGAAVLIWPSISALALLYVIGAYAVALGALGIVGAFSLPIDRGDKALMVLSGLVSILFGVVIYAKPGTGALALLTLIAAFALVTGLGEVVLAIGGKRLVESDLTRTFAPKPHPST
jgi:uncharacterized membrane protein HdeD (DUF308 family)